MAFSRPVRLLSMVQYKSSRNEIHSLLHTLVSTNMIFWDYTLRAISIASLADCGSKLSDAASLGLPAL